jgi:hypothetical protein
MDDRRTLEEARREAELAQGRYMRVDPENRMVADSLEADCNQKLRTLSEGIRTAFRVNSSTIGA